MQDISNSLNNTPNRLRQGGEVPALGSSQQEAKGAGEGVVDKENGYVDQAATSPKKSVLEDVLAHASPNEG